MEKETYKNYVKKMRALEKYDTGDLLYELVNRGYIIRIRKKKIK